jgi:hypothetical protein
MPITHIGEGRPRRVHSAPLLPVARTPSRDTFGARGHEPRRIRPFLMGEPFSPAAARR